MCGLATEQRKTRLRCSLCDVALCKKKDSSGVICWEAWHAAGGDELQESSKRRSDWLKEDREATCYAKRLRAAETEAEQRAFWTALAAEPLTGEAGAAEGAGAADGEAQV